MLRTAYRHRIGKFGLRRRAGQRDILHLHIAIRPVVTRKQNIDAGIFTIFHFTAEAIISCKFRHIPGRNRLGHDAVRMRGVDTNESIFDFHQFPAIG